MKIFDESMRKGDLNGLKAHLRRLLLLSICAAGESPFPRHNRETGSCILQKNQENNINRLSKGNVTDDSRAVSKQL